MRFQGKGYYRLFMTLKTNKIIKIWPKLLLFLVSLALYSVYANKNTGLQVFAQDNLTIHLFYSDTCPHCADEEAFLSKISYKYPTLKIKTYEITKDRDNLKLFMEVGKKLGDRSGRVPFLVIGQEYVLGYLSDETHGAQIESEIQKSLQNMPNDLVEQISQSLKESTNSEKQGTGSDKNASEKTKFEINFPILGKTDVNSLTLPIMTIVLGLADGFNPCAMWALLFLISLLLGTKDRKKMWLLGGTFILTSGFVYFLFMAAWLNLFLIIGYAVAVRVLIGLVASGLGGYYLWSYWKNYKKGCLIEGDEKRQQTFKKLRTLTENKNLLLALGGMVILAMAVNVVELLCSAGIPAIYTKALTMTNLPSWQYYLYLIAYIFFYMLDDMVVFIIAMVTLEAVGVKQSYARYSHLLGGIIMLAIGVLMLFKPEILMFG